MKVAMIKCEPEKRNGFCGPKEFSETEKKIAENHGVIIREQDSYTMQETYFANTCPHCNAFVGNHYLFPEYFVEAMNEYCEYIVIDLS
jgi:hypothetical protein